MSNKKNIGIGLLAAGVIILIVSITFDMFGIGGDMGTFGYKQIAGVVIGAVAAVAGLILMRSRKPA